jgi:hypothetical protein
VVDSSGLVSHSLLWHFRSFLTICPRITIEATLSVIQGYEQLSLYKELFDARDQDEETWQNNNVNALQFDTRTVPRSDSSVPEDDLKRAVPEIASFEDELVHSIRSRDREALELVFGVPLPVGGPALFWQCGY